PPPEQTESAPSSTTGDTGPAPTSESGPEPPTSLPAGVAEKPNEVGGLCRSMLRPQPRTNLVIEIDVGQTRPPDEASISHLAGVLGTQAAKPVAVDKRSVTLEA